MELFQVLITLALVVLGMLVVSSFIFIGSSRLIGIRGEIRERAVSILPFLALLGVVLAFNSHFRSIFHDISWWLGMEVTHLIVRVEGHSVARLQEFGGPELNAFFSFIYVFGYVFLLVFPLIAYFVLDRLDMFKSLTIAYTMNYGLGIICYVIFVAYGPRNMIPELVEEPLYLYYPQYQLLTSEINEYTNVFPSLHTSLSATVMFFAWRTRDRYRLWMPVAMFLGTSVIISTMYLAIHWMIDVVAGIILAWISYYVSILTVKNDWLSRTDLLDYVTNRVRLGR